ncbi:sodium:solute symporter [Micrococcales bacterium 31B]|nr:sodium:solute symporter [Micrococcales bacterium 31B]
MHFDPSYTTELIVFLALFLLVTVMGFMAGKWRRPKDMESLDEWGLGGRSFGGWITWFLLGGDVYTAYTFVAIPALIWAAGAAGFFAVPYTIVVYPLMMLFLLRLWSVSRVHGYVTPSDFVRGRFGSPTLALLVAITGIIAVMPYIALQLVGVEAVLKTMGMTGHIPITIAFVILALYTVNSGLRAPALIAFVKDILIYIVILVAVIYIPQHLGGWGDVFTKADAKFAASPNPADGIILGGSGQLGYATLALGSALALFMYPHTLTSVLAAKDRGSIRRNMAALPAYTLLLGLIALLGYFAIAAGTKPMTFNGKADNNTIVPQLFEQMFPDWFTGVAFAAIAIGALVPAAIMSIAAANLWTRNVYKEYINKHATAKQEARQSKWASLFVKLGALIAIVALDPQFAVDLQLIGGVIILQTLPALMIGLYTNWFHRIGLICGWVVGMVLSITWLWQIPSYGFVDGVKTMLRPHFGGSALPLKNLGIDSDFTIYVGFVGILVNIAVTVIVTLIVRAAKVREGIDATSEIDYHLDAGDDRVKDAAAAH